MVIVLAPINASAKTSGLTMTARSRIALVSCPILQMLFAPGEARVSTTTNVSAMMDSEDTRVRPSNNKMTKLLVRRIQPVKAS